MGKGANGLPRRYRRLECLPLKNYPNRLFLYGKPSDANCDTKDHIHHGFPEQTKSKQNDFSSFKN